MKEIIGYCRVSTDVQAVEGYSLEAQAARIRAWAKTRGVKSVIIHQDAISGSRADNRPGLKAAIDEACAKRGLLVVCALSRLARSTQDAIGISNRLGEAGADLVSLSESIDTTSAAGKMVFRLISVFSEFERDLISERIRSVFAHMRQQGRRLGGTLPYGYDCPGGKYLKRNVREQAGIRAIVKMRRDGLSVPKIKVELEKRRVKSKGGVSTWHLSTIIRILQRAGARSGPANTVPLIYCEPPKKRKAGGK